MVEQGTILEIFTALEDKTGQTFWRNDPESMIYMRKMLKRSYTSTAIREICSQQDNDGYDCVRLTSNFDRVEGFIECKNHIVTPLTKDDLGNKALRMT